MKNRQLSLIILFSVLSTAATAADTHAGWSYSGAQGPEHWGELDPVYATCRLGKNQSPVNLDKAAASGSSSAVYSYKAGTYTIENNGHTIQATPQEGGQTLRLGDKTFTLKQFHFHTPSEHSFQSKYFPMEAHFVHQNEDGELAVLAVIFNEGEDNTALAPLLAKKLKAGESTALSEAYDITPLLPQESAHFRLNGSLTTPPCSEGVNWLVFKKPVNAGAAQIGAMREMIGQANNRPVQALNARLIIEE